MCIRDSSLQRVDSSETDGCQHIDIELGFAEKYKVREVGLWALTPQKTLQHEALVV